MRQRYDKLAMQKAHEVFHVMSMRVSEKDMLRIREAFKFACEAYADQKNSSGELYVIHSTEVVRIVAVELQLDVNPVIAAFLYYVVKVSKYTIDDIQERFGKEVSFLVSVLNMESKENDNIHVLLIKLADHLHDMRTLGVMSALEQKEIVGEGDTFFVPLANRLGLYLIKDELENRSFRYHYPQEYAEIARMLNREELCHEGRLHIFTDTIRMALGKEFGNIFVQALFRAPYSIWRQMQEMGVDFSQVPSRHIVEIVFPCEDMNMEKDIVLRIYSRLTSVFIEKSCSVISSMGKGYQACHVQLLSEFGNWEDVYIISERMERIYQLGVLANGL